VPLLRRERQPSKTFCFVCLHFGCNITVIVHACIALCGRAECMVRINTTPLPPQTARRVHAQRQNAWCESTLHHYYRKWQKKRSMHSDRIHAQRQNTESIHSDKGSMAHAVPA
jgi:hypothetical protein